ncbi:MAG: TraR/DksA C4-type zinc finger protein [Flavobacteriales bacterium]
MISEKDRNIIREKIKEEIIVTIEKISALKELTKPISPENAIGRISRMDAINNKTINEHGLRKQKEKLKKLEYAQTKIEDNDFGVCSSCKNEIQIGRILLMPQSNYCVRCSSRR